MLKLQRCIDNFNANADPMLETNRIIIVKIMGNLNWDLEGSLTSADDVIVMVSSASKVETADSILTVYESDAQKVLSDDVLRVQLNCSMVNLILAS